MVGIRESRWKYLAFASAFSSNVAKASIPSSSPEYPMPASWSVIAWSPASARIPFSSRSFPLLRVARRIRRSAVKRRLLSLVEPCDSLDREVNERIELRAVERSVFAGPLHFDELPR